jgi:hypothetical protein
MIPIYDDTIPYEIQFYNLNSMIPSILVVNHHPHSQSGEHGKGDEMENILGTSAKPCGHMGHRVEIPAQVGAQ